jgi:hypothetical protein
VTNLHKGGVDEVLEALDIQKIFRGKLWRDLVLFTFIHVSVVLLHHRALLVVIASVEVDKGDLLAFVNKRFQVLKRIGAINELGVFGKIDLLASFNIAKREVFSLLLVKVSKITGIFMLIPNTLAGMTHQVLGAGLLRIVEVSPLEIIGVGLASVIVARINLATLPE